ncbi:hypothetical protein JOM56_000017 [Amanita muscaria]
MVYSRTPLFPSFRSLSLSLLPFPTMKFAQTIVALVTSLAFINIAFSTPLTSKTDIDVKTGNLVAAPNKVPNYSTSAEGNLPKRQSQEELNNILTDMDEVISKLGANNRAEFTTKLIHQLYVYNGLYNYVVCHVKHSYNFSGKEGVDWAHYKTTFDSYQYDIVIGNAGTFTRNGDGGATNWAYSTAYVKSVSNSGGSTTVTFVESF